MVRQQGSSKEIKNKREEKKTARKMPSDTRAAMHGENGAMDPLDVQLERIFEGIRNDPGRVNKVTMGHRSQEVVNQAGYDRLPDVAPGV